jgi:hypothetical protein
VSSHEDDLEILLSTHRPDRLSSTTFRISSAN